MRSMARIPSGVLRQTPTEMLFLIAKLAPRKTPSVGILVCKIPLMSHFGRALKLWLRLLRMFAGDWSKYLYNICTC